MKALIFLLAFVGHLSWGQNLVSQPESLTELSGLEFINDTLLVALNDGGDDPVLYFLNLEGKLLHRALVSNAKNVDWEDMAYDGQRFLYVGDFGNNKNKRKDLAIYKVDLSNWRKAVVLPSEKISFRYPDQYAFPPPDSLKFFDCEGMIYFQDSLFLFTKSRAKPWNGNSKIYSLSTNESQQVATARGQVFIGSTGWWQDAVTAATQEGKYCYLLTYNRVLIYKIRRGKMHYVKGKPLRPITQKEAIAVNSSGTVVIGDERSRLLGGGDLRIETWGK